MVNGPIVGCPLSLIPDYPEIEEQNYEVTTKSEEEESDSLLTQIIKDNVRAGIGENSISLLKRKRGRPRKNAADG